MATKTRKLQPDKIAKESGKRIQKFVDELVSLTQYSSSIDFDTSSFNLPEQPQWIMNLITNIEFNACLQYSEDEMREKWQFKPKQLQYSSNDLLDHIMNKSQCFNEDLYSYSHLCKKYPSANVKLQTNSDPDMKGKGKGKSEFEFLKSPFPWSLLSYCDLSDGLNYNWQEILCFLLMKLFLFDPSRQLRFTRNNKCRFATRYKLHQLEKICRFDQHTEFCKYLAFPVDQQEKMVNEIVERINVELDNRNLTKKTMDQIHNDTGFIRKDVQHIVSDIQSTKSNVLLITNATNFTSSILGTIACNINARKNKPLEQLNEPLKQGIKSFIKYGLSDVTSTVSNMFPMVGYKEHCSHMDDFKECFRNLGDGFNYMNHLDMQYVQYLTENYAQDPKLKAVIRKVASDFVVYQLLYDVENCLQALEAREQSKELNPKTFLFFTLLSNAKRLKLLKLKDGAQAQYQKVLETYGFPQEVLDEKFRILLFSIFARAQNTLFLVSGQVQKHVGIYFYGKESWKNFNCAAERVKMAEQALEQCQNFLATNGPLQRQEQVNMLFNEQFAQNIHVVNILRKDCVVNPEVLRMINDAHYSQLVQTQSVLMQEPLTQQQVRIETCHVMQQPYDKKMTTKNQLQKLIDPEESKDVVLPAASSCTQMQLAEQTGGANKRQKLDS